MPTVRRISLSGLALAGVLAFAGSASAAKAPFVREQIGAPVATLITAGPDRGRLVVDVPVRGPELARSLVRHLQPAQARHTASVQVVLRAGGRVLALGTGRANLILGLRHAVVRTHRIVFSRSVASRVVGGLSRRRPLVVEVTENAVLTDGGPVVRRSLAHALRQVAIVTAPRPPAPPAPVCEPSAERVNYARATPITITCTGTALTVRTGAPTVGRATAAASTTGRVTIVYKPPARFVGRVRLPFRAVGPGGIVATTVSLRVQPFLLRAIGDSVTAGFGFLGDGTEMGSLDLPFCIPPAVPNNRCSSNSPNGVGSTNPTGWSPDFGLGNGVAWPAQFARSLGLSGQSFQNWAVSGSTPADWDTGGNLNDILQQVVDQSPDLTVMTLGANPLLDSFITGSGEFCAFSANDAQLVQCVQKYVTQQALGRRLSSVVVQLLQAQENRVVVSQYHLAIPSLNLFTAHQIEVILDTINGVERQTIQALPQYGTRVFLMSPPRFDIGRAPGIVRCNGAQVDGPSRQSEITQTVLAADPFQPFCSSTDYWIISPDTGIHPSRAGHAQFAASLAALASANGLIPPLPAGQYAH